MQGVCGPHAVLGWYPLQGSRSCVLYGIPVVTTTLLAEQLEWADQKHLLDAELNPQAFSLAVVKPYSDEGLWTRIRENASAEILKNHSKQSPANAMQEVVSGLIGISQMDSDHWSKTKMMPNP